MNDKIKSWFFLISLSIIWGSSFLLIKIALMDNNGIMRLSPDVLASLRLSLAFLFLSPLIFKYCRKIKKADLPYLLISGFLGNGIPSFLFAYAELKISSAVAGMLNSLVPVFTIVIAAVFFSFAWKIKHIIGILTGILGTCLIVFKFNQPEQISTPILPILMVLAGSLCYAISLNIIKYKLQHLHPNLITSVSFLFIGIPSLFYLLSTDFYGLILIGEISNEALIAVFLLALIGTSLAVLVFNRLIKISSPVFTSSITYLIPIVAVVFGVFYGESISGQQMIGLFTLLVGVLIINVKKPFRRIKQVFIFGK